LSKDETRRDSSLTLTISHYTVIKTMFLTHYLCHTNAVYDVIHRSL